VAPSDASGLGRHRGQGKQALAEGQDFAVERAIEDPPPPTDERQAVWLLASAREQQRARARRRSTAARLQTGYAGPQLYDEAGFPIYQRLPSFTERVRRLLFG
jgi:hypothetical protein